MDPRVERCNNSFGRSRRFGKKGSIPPRCRNFSKWPVSMRSGLASYCQRATRTAGPIYSQPSPPGARRGGGTRRIDS